MDLLMKPSCTASTSPYRCLRIGRASVAALIARNGRLLQTYHSVCSPSFFDAYPTNFPLINRPHLRRLSCPRRPAPSICMCPGVRFTAIGFLASASRDTAQFGRTRSMMFGLSVSLNIIALIANVFSARKTPVPFRQSSSDDAHLDC